MSGRYEFIEHTAEVGIRATGASVEEVFAAAAEAVAVLLGAWLPGEGSERAVAVEGVDREALLVSWIDELLYVHEAEEAVFGGVRVDLVEDRRLEGALRVAPQAGRALEGVGVKAATYHGLSVARLDDGWIAIVYVDV